MGRSRPHPCEFLAYIQSFLPCDPVPVYGFEPVQSPLDRVYYYHSDHLNSSTYVTDDNGRPVAYYDYLPFGEVAVEHNQTTNFNNGYKFNAKELDEATGMSYYGARYYDLRISVFVSVDPLAEQTFEPYSYVGNNPIMFIDPTGMSKDDIVINNKDNKEIARIKVDTGDVDYVFDIDLDIDINTPLVYDTGMSIKGLKNEYDAVGLNLNTSATVGGGIEFGISLVYFLNGESEGNLGIYASKGGNVGVGGGVGFSFFGSKFNRKADSKFFNVKGFEGGYNAASIGALVIGTSKTWSNEKGTHDELYPGHRYKTTWTSYSLGYGTGLKALSQVLGKAGKANITYSGGTSTLIQEFKSKKVKK